jgi:RNA polymerase sigma-70 factor (ECF subfamily)
MAKSLFCQLPSLFTVSDEQAMWRVQTQDDAEAFARLVERWQEPIRGLCARMIGDLHRAEDLAQEVFVRLYNRRKAYVASAKFSTYLWRIALNLCYDELRRVRRRSEMPLAGEATDDPETCPLALASAEPSPGDRAAAHDQARLVQRALLALPEIYRSVVVLRHYEDLKFSEIAEVLGIPEGTVKSRMSEAMNQLARWLRPRLDDSTGAVADAPAASGQAPKSGATILPREGRSEHSRPADRVRTSEQALRSKPVAWLEALARGLCGRPGDPVRGLPSRSPAAASPMTASLTFRSLLSV